jgi:hypothetical protein
MPRAGVADTGSARACARAGARLTAASLYLNSPGFRLYGLVPKYVPVEMPQECRRICID